MAAHPIATLPAYADLTEFQPRRGSSEACFASSKYSCAVSCSIAAAYYPSPVMWSAFAGDAGNAAAYAVLVHKKHSHLVVSLSKTLYPLLSTGSTHEDPSRHDKKMLIGALRIKTNQHNHTLTCGADMLSDQCCSTWRTRKQILEETTWLWRTPPIPKSPRKN